MEIRERIKKDIKEALLEIGINPPSISLERPKDKNHGDFSSNIAMSVVKLSKYANPNELATEIVKGIKKEDYLEKVEVIGGFINFYLSNGFLQNQVPEIVEMGDKYGSIDIGKGHKASVEYVSANPTGPLHIGNARGGPIGDVLANVLAKAGYSVNREYLHNNVGGQVQKLGESIYFELNPKEKPKDEVYYQGGYVKELSIKVQNELKARHESGLDTLSFSEFSFEAGEIAVEIMFVEIMQDTEAMGIKFNKVIRESDLKALAPKVIKELKGVMEKDGALWFAPNDEFLKDRETVVRKSDGEYTYFASDIVYHKQKFEEKNNLVIDVLGSNHSGHVPRLNAAIKALGFDVNKFHVILYQFVRVRKGKELLKMSKRAGNFITSKEVLEEVGKDAFRFFLLMHKPESHIDFDLELAKKKAGDNPVFYVQYAYSRICSIFKKSDDNEISKPDLKLLIHDEELTLIRHLLKLPELVEEVSRNFAVNIFASYAIELATLFHRFYEAHQVLSDNKEESQARLSLLKATRVTLKNTLDIIGIQAPEKM